MKLAWNWSEPGHRLKHLSTHHLRYIAQSGPFGTPVLKQIFEESSRRPYLITLFLQGISLRSINSPWVFWFPKRPFWKSSTQTNIGRGKSTPLFCDTFLMGKKLTFSETCLEPLWNQPETPSSSPSQTLCSFGYWIIELFCFLVAGMMCWSLCFGFIAGALSSASFPGKGQSPVSAPKSVWNRSETTLKHLPAHHFRLYALLVTASLLYFAF